jgi:hypothetical protein
VTQSLPAALKRARAKEETRTETRSQLRNVLSDASHTCEEVVSLGKGEGGEGRDLGFNLGAVGGEDLCTCCSVVGNGSVARRARRGVQVQGREDTRVQARRSHAVERESEEGRVEGKGAQNEGGPPLRTLLVESISRPLETRKSL